MGFWVICTTRLTASKPSCLSTFHAPSCPTSSSSSTTVDAASRSTPASTVLTSVDLPEPDTPATAVNWPIPKDTSSPSMERAETPDKASSPVAVRESSLSESARFANALAVGASPVYSLVGPAYTTSPPRSPASGPTSTR